MRFDIRFEDAQLHAAMREARRDLNQDIKQAMGEVGEGILLPAARRAVPAKTGTLRRSLTFRATTRGGYVTTRLTRRQGGRRFGLLEFGGTRKDVIEPRKARALRFGGRFTARVTTPRVYPQTLHVTRASDQQQPRIIVALETRITDVLQAHITRHSTYTA